MPDVGLAGIVLTLLMAYGVFKFVTWFVDYRKWVQRCKKLPGTSGHWLLGHTKEFPGIGEDGIRYLYSSVEKNPVLSQFWMSAFDCMAMCHHPDSMRAILKSSATVAPKPTAIGTGYIMVLPWLGDGLLISNGDKWTRNRRLLTPAFHFDVLKPYVRVFNDTSDIFLEKLEGFAKSVQEFDLYKHVALLAFDNMMRCAMSCKTDCQAQGDNDPYVVAVNKLTQLWTERSFRPHYFIDWIYFNCTAHGREFLRLSKYTHDVTEGIIKTRQEQLKSGEQNRDSERYLDFLDILLTAKDENGQGLSDLDIRSEVDTFLFEGHDTTSSAVSFTLMSLAEHQDIQDKVREEVGRLLEGRKTDVIEWNDLPKLEYLTQCIKEGLRLHSPVYLVSRTITEDLVINSHTIPKGASVGIGIYNLHHNPVVWGEDHMEYRPDRFRPDNIRDMDPFAFVPFSGGPRNCIGQNFAMNELKVTIARIIHRYRLQMVPGFKVEKQMTAIISPKNGIKMTAQRIKQSL